MKPDLGQKLNKKILISKKELETNLFAYHAKITKHIKANDRLAKMETYIKKSSNCLQRTIEKMMSLNLCLLSIHSNNAAETINQVEFYPESITEKMPMY